MENILVFGMRKLEDVVFLAFEAPGHETFTQQSKKPRCNGSCFLVNQWSGLEVRTVGTLVGRVEESQVEVVVNKGLAGTVVGGLVEGEGAGEDPSVLELWSDAKVSGEVTKHSRNSVEIEGSLSNKT